MTPNDNLPPGVTDRDISGDGRLKLCTVEMTVRVYVAARDDDGAIEQAEQAVTADNINVLKSEVTDTEVI